MLLFILSFLGELADIIVWSPDYYWGQNQLFYFYSCCWICEPSLTCPLLPFSPPRPFLFLSLFLLSPNLTSVLVSTTSIQQLHSLFKVYILHNRNKEIKSKFWVQAGLTGNANSSLALSITLKLPIPIFLSFMPLHYVLAKLVIEEGMDLSFCYSI